MVSGHPERADYVIEAMSCGAAFFDYDNDGWLDILVLSGSRFGDPPADGSNRLYKNNRDGTFTDVTARPGLFRTGYAYGVTVGDYNNDGFEDLFITDWGQNVLYRNNGDGTFTDVTKEAGLLDPQAAVRVRLRIRGLRPRRQARPVRFQLPHLRHGLGAARRRVEKLQCGRRVLRPARAPLRPPLAVPQQRRRHVHGCYRRRRGSAKRQGGYGLTVVAADFDNDGWPDIYVACDSTPSLMFRNNHDGTFTEQALETGVALSDDGMVQAGMGWASAISASTAICTSSRRISRTTLRPSTSTTARAISATRRLRSGLGVETRFVTLGRGRRGPGQ